MLAIYTRLSKDDVNKKNNYIDESNSIKNQKREGLIFAGDKPYKLYDEGKGFSGTLRIKERPKLKQLLLDIEDGEITSVWMRKQDRLVRSGITVLLFCDAIKKNNVQLFFGDKGEVNLNDPTEYLHLTVMAAFDEFKPSSQSVVTKANLKLNAEEGKVCGTIPYGYYTENSFPFVDFEQAKVINEIYDSYLEGKGYLAIANMLNGNSTPTKYTIKATQDGILNEDIKKILWQTNTVVLVLKSKWYNGTRDYQGKEYKVPRIVDEVKYNKVQKAIILRKSKRHNFRTKNNFLLRGLIKCEKCGKTYAGKNKALKGEKTYACGSKQISSTNCGSAGINMSSFDSFIIKHLFKSKGLLNHLQEIQSDNSIVIQLKTDIETTSAKIRTEEARVNKYANWLGDKLKDDDLILNKYENSKKSVTKLKALLSELKIKEADASNSEVLDKYKNTYNDFQNVNDFDLLEEAVNEIIETIKLKSIIDSSGKLVFLIEIIYKGFNEASIFITTRPHKKWLYSSNTRTEATPEEIQNDIDALEFLFGDIKPEGKVFTEADVKQDFYSSSHILETVTIDKSELIDFNK